MGNFISASGRADFSDFNHPKLRSHRAKISSVQLTNRPSKFNEVEWSDAPQLCQLCQLCQLRHLFPMKNFDQPFKNIISTSEWYEYFSENPASRNYRIDLIRDVLSRILLVKQLVKSCQ
jgi:hypothetical protein